MKRPARPIVPPVSFFDLLRVSEAKEVELAAENTPAAFVVSEVDVPSSPIPEPLPIEPEVEVEVEAALEPVQSVLEETAPTLSSILAGMRFGEIFAPGETDGNHTAQKSLDVIETPVVELEKPAAALAPLRPLSHLESMFSATPDVEAKTVLVPSVIIEPPVVEEVVVVAVPVAIIAPVADALAALQLAGLADQADALEAEIESSAPVIFTFDAAAQEIQTFESETVIKPVALQPSVTFHKHGKLLLVKANDILAAGMWREIASRLKNPKMRNMQFFDSSLESEIIQDRTNLLELWRWVEAGLEQHPYFRILGVYGITAAISPSLSGYMHREKKRVAIRSAPYPCYSSSPDDITETIVPGMILRCIAPYGCFKPTERYMVKNLTSGGNVEVYGTSPIGRKSMRFDASAVEFTTQQIQEYFEDSDKFVLTETVRDLFPTLIDNRNAQLENLAIGAPGMLFQHVIEDVSSEVVKGNFMCSKDMRMAKTSEALAACEMIGSRKRAWIGPAVACLDVPKEFINRGVTDFKEITKISDLADPAIYHIMTMEFLKKNDDPFRKVRRSNSKKTWLRLVGEGKSIVDCPHCDQPLERPIKFLSPSGAVIYVNWTLYNGFVCRNPFCVWTEINEGRKRTIKSGIQKIAPTPWHNPGAIKAITHQGGYIDWDRKRHAECGNHVGRKRMCPKCAIVDSSWTPGIYKRIKKNYNTVVGDELHVTKGDSTTALAMLDMRGKHHIGNTGTPMSNSLVDMYPQFMWLFHTKSAYFPFDRVTGKSEYKERFCESIKITRPGTDRSHYKTTPLPKNPLDFWNFVAPLLVRRTRKDPVYLASLAALNLFIPHEESTVVPVRMLPQQALVLSSSINTFKADFDDYCAQLEEEGKSMNGHIVMTMMSRMRTGATIPGMLNIARPGSYDGGVNDPFEVGGKGVALSHLVSLKLMEGKKVVILSQFTLMRERLLQKFAHLSPLAFTSSKLAHKRSVLTEFRSNPDRKLAIFGPSQISMGVDLNIADVLISTDLMWAAGTQKQALMRLLGPTPYERWVEQYILNSAGSIDEHVYSVFYGKIAGMEQALDKRVVTRSAHEVNWMAFSERVIAQQAALEGYFIDAGDDEQGFALPELSDISLLDEERVA